MLTKNLYSNAEDYFWAWSSSSRWTQMDRKSQEKLRSYLSIRCLVYVRIFARIGHRFYNFLAVIEN
jgi:hypothetical protein